MKTRTITEDGSGTLNRLVNRLRYLADDAERKFIESGVISQASKKNS